MGAFHPCHLTRAPTAPMPRPRSTPASCHSRLAAWQLGETAALPEPSQGEWPPLRAAGCHKPSSGPGTAPSQPPPEHLKGEWVKMSMRGLAGPSLRCLTAILKALAMRWLQAHHGGWGKALFLRPGVWAVLVASLLPRAGSHHLPPGYAVHEIVRPRNLALGVGKATRGEVSSGWKERTASSTSRRREDFL